MTSSVNRALECAACGTASVPVQAVCPVCGHDDVREISLAADGVLYSHTTVHVGDEAPYTVGYVDIDGPARHRTFARFVETETGHLLIGMNVRRGPDGLWGPSRERG